MASTVASPCICICSLDENDICVGCYRSTQEIIDWASMDDDERRAVLARSAERARENNPFA